MPEVDQHRTEQDISFLMDLLSHDVLNNNQAVLGYLDLIKSLPGADDKAKECADRGISQLRTASMLIDSTKRLLTAVRKCVGPQEPVNMCEVLDRSCENLTKLFPHKRVRVDTSGVDPEATVLGGIHLHDLFGNLLANIVHLDTREETDITVTSSSEIRDGDVYWTVRVAAPTVMLPPGVDRDILSGSRDSDTSKVVRVSGLVVAGRIATLLGGGLRCEVTGPGEAGWCVFEATLKGAGPR